MFLEVVCAQNVYPSNPAIKLKRFERIDVSPTFTGVNRV